MAGSVSFLRYYGRVGARAWKDTIHDGKGLIVAIICAVAVTTLHVRFGLLTPSQQWPTVVANTLPAAGILGLFCLFHVFRAPLEIHNEDRASRTKELEAANKANEAIQTTLAETREGLLASRRECEEAKGQLSLRLFDPVLHFEPGYGTVPNTGKPCSFNVAIVNTGPEDVEQLQVFISYFVAQRISGSVLLKEIGQGSYIPAITIGELTSKQSAPISMDFADLFRIMKEFGDNGPTGSGYIPGVKLHATFRRRTDGKDFDMVGCYGTDLFGHILYTAKPFPVSLPEEIKGLLTLDEAAKYISSPDHWVQMVAECGTTANGEAYTRHR